MFQEGCSGSTLALDAILPYRTLSSPLPTERVQAELQRPGAAGSPEGSVVGFIKKVVFPSLLSHWGGGVFHSAHPGPEDPALAGGGSKQR